MIKVHQLKWNNCLSHGVFKLLYKGWPNSDKQTTHFFWGLGSTNIQEIDQVNKRGEEYYIIDVGYLTKDIVRYPRPSITDPKYTYFRFSKGGLHNDLSNVSNDPTRFEKLLSDGIEWAHAINDYKEVPLPKTGHILLCPSSDGVCNFMHRCSQEEWIDSTTKKLKEHTDKWVVLRNKPRPNNQWWGTTLKDSLKGASGLVTNMSLAAIEAAIIGIPALVSPDHVMSEICETDYSKIDNLRQINKDDLLEWGYRAANCQFTLDEIGKGVAYEYLR